MLYDGNLVQFFVCFIINLVQFFFFFLYLTLCSFCDCFGCVSHYSHSFNIWHNDAFICFFCLLIVRWYRHRLIPPFRVKEVWQMHYLVSVLRHLVSVWILLYPHEDFQGARSSSFDLYFSLLSSGLGFAVFYSCYVTRVLISLTLRHNTLRKVLWLNRSVRLPRSHIMRASAAS